MACAVFYAPAIHCDGCADSIKRSLGRLAGVKSVQVDVETKRIEVDFDDNAVGEQDVEQRLKAAGFPPSAS